MVKNYTYRLTSEGFAEFEAQMKKLGDTGQAAVDGLKAKFPELADASEKAQARMAAAQQRMEQAAKSSFQSLQASLDPSIAAQQRLAEGRETVSYAMARGVATDAQAAQALAQLEEQFRSTTAGVSLFSASLGTAKEALGLFGIALGVEKLAEFGVSLFESTAQIQKQAQVLGIGTDALQAYRAAAEEAQVDTATADSVIQRFTKSMGLAETSTGLQRQAFTDLHLTLTDLAGGPEAALPRAVSALLSITDVTERARIETELFGRSGQEIEPMLKAWADPDIVEHMKNLGHVIDSELVQRAAEADANIKQVWDELKVGVVESAAWLLDHPLVLGFQRLPQMPGAETPKTSTNPLDKDFPWSSFGFQGQTVADESPINVTAENPVLAGYKARLFAEKQLADAQKERLVIADHEFEAAQKIREEKSRDSDQEIKDTASIIENLVKERDTRAQNFAEWMDQLKAEHAMAGKSPELRAQDLAIMQAQKIAGRELTDVEKEQIDTLVAGTIELDKQRQYWQSLADDISRADNNALKKFFLTGEVSSKDFFDTVRADFATLEADLVQEALLHPIELQIVTSMKGGLSGLMQLLGLGDGSGGGLSGINLGPSIFGGGQSTSGGGNLGNSIGLPQWAMNIGGGSQGPIDENIPITPENPGLTGGGGFGSYLGAGIQGYSIGSANLFGGKQQGSEIGGTIGSIAGQFLGGPIGSFVGSVLGSAIGGLFGPKPSNYRADATFNASLTSASFGGDKPNDATVGMSQQVAQSIIGEAAQLLAYGVSLPGTLSSISIGQRDKSSYTIGGQTFRTSTVGNPGDLALQAIQQLLGSSTGGSTNLTQVLKGNKFGSLDELNKAVQFTTQVFDVITSAKPAATQTETAMKGLVDQLKSASVQAKALGLDVTALAAGAKKSFEQDIAMSIEQIQDPLKYALDLWKRDAQARVDAAADLGADLNLVKQYNDLLYKQAVGQASGGLTSGLQSLIQSLQYGSGSAAAPSQQYFSALSDFNTAKNAALSSGNPADISAFVSSAQTFLPIARGFLGTSERYGALVGDVTGAAQQLSANLNAPPIDIVPLIQATTSAGAATVDAVSQVVQAQAETNDKLNTLAGTIEALVRRLGSAT